MAATLREQLEEIGSVGTEIIAPLVEAGASFETIRAAPMLSWDATAAHIFALLESGKHSSILVIIARGIRRSKVVREFDDAVRRHHTLRPRLVANSRDRLTFSFGPTDLRTVHLRSEAANDLRGVSADHVIYMRLPVPLDAPPRATSGAAVDDPGYEVLFALPSQCLLAPLAPRRRFPTRTGAELWADSVSPPLGVHFAVARGTAEEIDELPQLTTTDELLDDTSDMTPPGTAAPPRPYSVVAATAGQPDRQIGPEPLRFATIEEAIRSATFIHRYCTFVCPLRGGVVTRGRVDGAAIVPTEPVAAVRPVN